MKHLLWFVLISSAFGQIGTNGTTSNPVPVTCISGCSSSGSTTANQGTPNTFANAWPVELTDGTNLLGTPSFPVRTDPTGTTPQPVTGTVAVSNFPASQNVVVTSALPAGANVIGHVIADTGSTTAVTGNVTVVQPTGSNLHVAVDSAPTVTGTVTSNQGTAAASAAGWSTISGNIAPSTVTWTNATGANTDLLIPCSGYGYGLITASQASASGGQFSVGVSYDNGTTFQNIFVGYQQSAQSSTPIQTAFFVTAPSTLNASAATPSVFHINIAGATHFRVRLSSVLTSGTVTFTAQAFSDPGVSPIPGTVVVNQPTGTNLHTVVDSGSLTALTTVTTVSTVSAARIVGNAGSTMDASVGAGTAPADGIAQLVRYVSTAPALTANQTVSEQADSAGTTFVRPYRRSQYKATASTITASTSPVTAVAAQGASIFADVTGFTVTVTTAATTATAFTITLSDGTANYVFDLDTGALATAAAAPTVLVVPFPSPLPATTANTAWTVTSSSATPTMHVVTNFVNNLAN